MRLLLNSLLARQSKSRVLTQFSGSVVLGFASQRRLGWAERGSQLLIKRSRMHEV
jgi:hypothetical protein